MQTEIEELNNGEGESHVPSVRRGICASSQSELFRESLA